MTNTFKQKLLLGTALVAVAGFAASAHAGVVVDTANDESASGDSAVSSPLTEENSDLLITTGGGTITIAANRTVGETTTDADGILALATGETLTITNTSNNTANQTLTVAGTVGLNTGIAALDIDVTAVANAAGASENLIVNFGNNVNLGTGTLTITSNDGAAQSTNTAHVNASGNFTGNIALDADTAVDGTVHDSSITFNGTAAQTITGNISAVTNGDGDVTVSNTAGTVTLNGNIGGTAAGTDDIALLTVNDSATLSTNGNIFATDIVLGSANTTAGTLTLTGTGKTVSATINSDAGGGDNGVLNVNGTYTFTGAIGASNKLDSIVIAAGKSATFQAAVDIAGAGASTLTLTSATSAVTLGTTTAAGIAFAGNIVGGGTVTLLGSDTNTTGQTITGDVGTSTTSIKSLTVANDTTVGANDAHSITGDLYATTVAFTSQAGNATDDSDAVLTIGTATGSDVVSVGTVTTAVDGDGTIVVQSANAADADTASFGTIGSSTKALKQLTLNSAANAGASVSGTFTGNVYVNNVTLQENGGSVSRMTFNGTSAQTVTSDIDGGNAGEGDIIVGNTNTPTVTFTGQLGDGTALGDFTVADGAKAILAGAANDFDGNLTLNGGTLILNQGVTLDVADVAVGTAEGTLALTIGATAAGVDEAATLTATTIDWEDLNGTNDAAKLLLKEGTGVVLDDQGFLIVDAGTLNNGPAAAGETVDDEYAFYSFTAYVGDDTDLNTSVDDFRTGDSDDVVVLANRVDSSSVTVTDNNANAADGILDTTVAEYNAGDQDFKDVYDSVRSSSLSNVDERVEATQPAIDGGNVVAATTVASITSNLIQLASTDAQGSGIAAGNISNGLRAWGQVFGQTGTQDTRDNIDGYDIDTYGFAVGLDTQALAEQMVVGLAFSYANSEVDSENANNAQTDIDTYQVTLYGTYNVDEATYISGQLGYAFGSNDTDRYDIGGVNGVDAHGSYDSNQFIARLEAGRAYEVGKITTLTPKVSADYNYYDADSYRETGAGGAGLNVDQDSLSSFKLGAGVDADWLFQQADGSYLKPQVRVGASYDLVGDEVQTTSDFIGGGSAFQTKGFDSQDFAVTVGTGVTYFTTSNWEFTANYDYEWKQDYDSHAGFLRAGYKF